MTDPGADAAPVRAFWRDLALPGLFDVHVHFLPPPIQQRVWAAFDSAGGKIGRPWPIRYRLAEEERVALLRDFGVRRFGALPYAHRPGVATYLNEWARDFAARVPDALWSATFFPEPGVGEYVADLVAAGVEVFKVHVQVGDFPLDDPHLDPVWALLEETSTPVVVHAGSGPVPGPFTGPGPLRRVLARHPALTAVVAHLGAPEYAEFVALAEEFPRVHLDTTMVFTDFFEDAEPFPRGLVPRLVELQDRIVLGSDFPSIPYPYAHQLESLAGLGLGEDWLRAVCWGNPVALFGERSDRNIPDSGSDVIHFSPNRTSRE